MKHLTKTGIIGTMGTVIDNKILDNANTTPESNLTQRYLKEMVDKDMQYCVMEVSSHSLDLKGLNIWILRWVYLPI